jgi:hypothetical protein
VPDTIELNGILERLDDRFLPDNVFEQLRPEFTGENLVLHF